MFTGLIEKIGEIVRMERTSTGSSMTIACGPWNEPLQPGESVAVQGACLTVVRAGVRDFACDLLDETVGRTNLAALRPGARVNLERALRSDARLGGHFVTGHVDGVGEVRAIDRVGRDRRIEVLCPEPLMEEIVPKGSITCNGISLTVTRVTSCSFDVHIIPHTWENTTLGEAGVGSRINVETDILAKYVRRALRGSGEADADPGLTMDALRNAGY